MVQNLKAILNIINLELIITIIVLYINDADNIAVLST